MSDEVRSRERVAPLRPPERSREGAVAPGPPASRGEVETGLARLASHPLLRAFMEVADASVAVLNQQRQILLANSRLFELLPPDVLDDFVGLRPGEALGCLHAVERPGGCGSSPECAACGAVLALVHSERHREPVERECLMTVDRGAGMEALELRVRASPLEVDGVPYTVLGLRDISAEKRREALERVFLHDVSNTLSPLLAWTQVLAAHPQEAGQAARHIGVLARRLAGDIEDQRVLLQAESGVLVIHRGPVSAQGVLAAARSILEGHPVARDRTIELLQDGPALSLQTDESLLVRVLVNMLKNALEATPAGGVVRASAAPSSGGRELRIWNAGAIAPDVALRIFKRSFSTKNGRSRGLGTFSMKLFGEHYLGGRVGFTSSEAEGTTFFIRLPD
jgi:signal transduction histidine kinase